MNINKSLQEVFFYRGVIPHQALDYMAEHRDEAIPFLMAELKNGIVNSSKTGDYYVGHLFSLLLLAQFKEKQAFPLLIDLLNLPIENIDRLLGDVWTELLPSLMINLFDGNLDALFNLLIKSDADHTLRYMIGCCLATLIYHKLVSADEVTTRLQQQIASGKMNEDKAFFTAVANLVLCVHLELLYDTVIAAFNAEMIDQKMIDLTFFKAHWNDAPEKLIAEGYRAPFVSVAAAVEKWEGYHSKTPLAIGVGRNDPCPCGRGPKYKDCCQARFRIS